jgi:prolyl 4-hydroxylase
VECYANTSQFGLEQRLPKNPNERELTTKRIGETVEYMKKVWNEDEFIKVRHKCKNTHEDCTFWAAVGECEENEKYMKTNCAPACYSCDLLDIRHRCPIEPDNVCIWKPGDLNTLFENIVDNADGKGEYEKFNPKALSRPKMSRNGTQVEGVEVDGPWIVLLENFVSEEEADRLVEIGKQQGYERSADVGKEKPDGSHDSLVSEARTSHNTWCQEKSCYEDPMVKPVIERIAEVSKTGVQNSEYLQLLQYEPSQYYKQHHDYIGHHRDMPCGVRILTLFIYLNDVEEGGGTSFPLVNDGKGIIVQPKKGNAVLWPSVLDNEPESKDGRTEHEALPVLKGLKYGANAWIHSRDFKAAFEKNCH